MVLRVLLTLIIMLLPLGTISSSSLSASADSRPTSIALSWEECSGAVYYDIYNNGVFTARLAASELSYELTPLYSSTEYNITIAARDEANNNLDAAWLSATTDTWEGLYRWVNETDKDNKGKLKELNVRVELKIHPSYGQYPEVWFINEDGSENRIFPLFDFDDPEAGKWHKYKENSEAGIAYRENADRFNITSFNPSKWKLDKIFIDRDETTAYILTSILSMELTTWSKFVFFEDGKGKKYLSLSTVGERGITDTFIFKNPNPGEGDAFILSKID